MKHYFVHERDLKFWLLEMRRTKGFTSIPMDKETADDLKRRIRSYTGKPVSNRVAFGGYSDSDSYIIKFPLPADIKTAEDADLYFMQNEFIEFVPTYYDCTGKLFTRWYKIFQKPNGEFWAYHRISRDV